MADRVYHPNILIEIDKTYCYDKYKNKSMEFINKKLEDIVSDKTGWSSAVMDAIQQIIEINRFNIKPDFLEPRVSSFAITTIEGNNNKSIDKAYVKNILDSINSTNNDKGHLASTEIYITNSPKYKSFDEVLTAQIIVTLSKLSIYSDKLWTNITFIMPEIGNSKFYFKRDDGTVLLSSRTPKHINSNIDDYIRVMNEWIEGKSNVPIYNQ